MDELSPGMADFVVGLACARWDQEALGRASVRVLTIDTGVRSVRDPPHIYNIRHKSLFLYSVVLSSRKAPLPWDGMVAVPEAFSAFLRGIQSCFQHLIEGVQSGPSSIERS